MGFIKFEYIVMIISRFEHRYDSYHFSVTGGRLVLEDRGLQGDIDINFVPLMVGIYRA